MPKEYEYTEGKRAQENFERGMKAVFQASKDAVASKKKPAKKRAKKTGGHGVSRDSDGEA